MFKKGRKVEGEMKTTTWKVYERLRHVFGDVGVMVQKSRNIAKNMMLEDRGALPPKEEDFVRTHNAMHEENFLNSWI